MFSSFKERLNTGLTTLHERGHATTHSSTAATSTSSTTPGAEAAVETPGKPTDGDGDDESSQLGSLNSLVSPHSPIPSSTLTLASTAPSSFHGSTSSFVSLASRISGGVASTSSSALFFRRPAQSKSSADLIPAHSSSSSAQALSGEIGLGIGIGGGSKLARLVQQLTLDPKEEKADSAELEKIREIHRQLRLPEQKRNKSEGPTREQDGQQGEQQDQPKGSEEQQQESTEPAGTELSEAVIEKLELLQRYEARFPDLAGAFKKIVQEKIAAEAVLKATTALDDLSDVEALEAHMQNMTHKSEMSMQEIRRLSEELRSTLKEKDAESASQAAMIEDLRNQLVSRQDEIELLKNRDLNLDGFSDTSSIHQQQQLQHLGHHSNASTKVNSIDLTSIGSQQPTSSTSSLSVISDSLQSTTSSATTTATTPPPPPASKEKKSRGGGGGGDLKKKDQALRELMVRLESVLKEKNQAMEDQEDAVEQMNQLRVELEKEVKVNKEITEKMDLLQSQVAEIEERSRRELMARKRAGVQETQSSPPEMGERFVIERDSEDIANADPSHLILQEDLSAAQAELETVLRRESETLKAKKEIEATLTDLQQAHDLLQDSNSELQNNLAVATTQVKELEDLAIALGETKHDLVEAQEEIYEKQQLLDLERNWREEAEGNRDLIKREHESAIKSLKQDLAVATERQEALQLDLEQARANDGAESENASRVSELQKRIDSLEQHILVAAKEREVLECAVSERLERTEELSLLSDKIACHERESDNRSQQIKELITENAVLEAESAEHRALTELLQVEKDKAAAAFSELQQQEQIMIAKIRELESERDDLQQGHEQADSSADIASSLAKNTERGTAANQDELEAKIAQLEAEIQSLSQAPSKNALKKLRQELNHIKKAKQDAEATINALQTELEVAKAQAASSSMPSTPLTMVHPASDNETSGLEELSSLKQEREELSEKLTRLERLHQGFERSSFEKIRGLEKELALLMEQKLALEAQVQEQSDLLIKEKEKEKEIEQARVADGIERVTLELAAVRTAERFASNKVTELAKDRDMVIEKVVKLEKRLEKLNECKVGQEQSLTGRIEELIREKQDLETQMVTMKAEFENLRSHSEEEKEHLNKTHGVLAKEHDLAKTRIVELESELKVVSEKMADTSKAQELEEQLTALKIELQAKSKKFDIAQGQAQVQRTLHTEKVSDLTNQIQTLRTERDSLAQSKIELEPQIQDAMEQAGALQQQLKVLEEDNERLMSAKTESQEQMSELQAKISALGVKERDHKEAFTLAKDTIHQRDEDLSTTHKLLKEAESSLEKTIQKLSKLELDKQSLSEELSSTKSNLTKAQQETKAMVTKSTSQLSAASLDLQRLQANHVKLLQERDRTTQERDSLIEEKEASKKEVQMRQAELETLQRMQDSAETQMREYQTQLTEARNRVDTLEELTSIAKRVAETKVVEFETLNNKSKKLEDEISSAKDQMRVKEEEHKNMERRLRANIEETRDVLGEEISDLTGQVGQCKEEIEVMRAKGSENENEIAEMRRIIEDHSQVIENLETEVQELKNRKRDLELELQHFKDLEEILAKEKVAHEAAADEFKMRENHLRTINKTLKDEVRKLQKQLPGSPLPSPSIPYSPYSQSNFPQTPGGSNSSNQQQNNTPSTPRPKSASATNGGRSFSTPVMNLTPPATPRFHRQQPPPDEDVNIEYLKNVLLNFMEHKDRRQQLIPVVAEMLRLSTEETKRFSKIV